MFTCNKCGGYSESRICPSCRRNENLAEDLDDNQRRLQRESVWEQERLQQESIWEQQKIVEQQEALQLKSIQEQERLQRESIAEQERLQRISLLKHKRIQENTHINSIRAKMLDLSLLALSDEKKAKLGAELLFKSRSFSDHVKDLYDDVTNSEFLSDCFFEIHFAKFINFNESDWVGEGEEDLEIKYQQIWYSECDGLIENTTNILRFKVFNNLYDDFVNSLYQSDDDDCDDDNFLVFEQDDDLLAWLKRRKDVVQLDQDPDIFIDQLWKFRDKIDKIRIAENEKAIRENQLKQEQLQKEQLQKEQLQKEQLQKEQVKSRKGAMRAKGSRHPDNVRSIIESLIFIAAGYVTFSYNSHSVYNLMGVDFSRAPVPVLASIVIAFLVCTLFFKNFSRQNPLSSRYNNIGIYYLWLGSSLTIFLLVFWKELSPNYRLATMGAILIAPAIPKINALLSAICRASILGFIAFFVSKILGCIALIVFGYVTNLANR